MTREQFISEVRACQGQLRRFLTSLCGDAVLADDIAQEALVRAYVASGHFVGNFKAWLFRVAYNCFVDNIRKLPEPTESLDAHEVQQIVSDDGEESAFRKEELLRALARIPEKERTAIVLFYFEELSVKEIASVMQISSGTVKYYLSVGRNHLKEIIRL
ncbi:MAG: RNA polymerase sigma factor [Bacteroidaceae bacterium]|nr:RNA polymerase sigma factor [Bacteroidaceae bacterium]